MGAGEGVARVVAEAGALVAGLGEALRPMAERLGALGARLEEGRFHLAVLGQFKRGKSTLINALLGETVVPSSVVPVTAIPTFIRSGPVLSVRVSFLDGRPPEAGEGLPAEALPALLATFVTEEGNPTNARGVAEVEVFHPSPLLHRGVVLVDTPGIGSTLRHNTEATLNFLPSCDAALFLVSADPPVTEVEVEFLRQVRTKVPRLFFVLNKVDYLTADEVSTAVGFLRRVLVEQADVDEGARILCVSARRGLEARVSGDAAAWEASGMGEVEGHLVDFLATEKTAALRRAVAGKAADVLGEVLLNLRLTLQSLVLPLDDLKRRSALFETAVDEARRQRVAARDLLAGDRRRVHEFLEEHAAKLRTEAACWLEGVVLEAVGRGGDAEGVDEEVVQRRLDEEVPGFFEHRAGTTTELFRARMAQTLAPHQERAHELTATIRTTASELFQIPCHVPDGTDDFEMVRQPYWVTNAWASSLHAMSAGLVDRLLPGSVRRRRVLERLRARAAALVIPNVENLRWATFQSIDHTFIRFGSALDRRLEEAVDTTLGAVRAVVELRESCSEAVAAEAERLEGALTRLEEYRVSLDHEGPTGTSARRGRRHHEHEETT